MESGSETEKVQANTALVDYLVGTVNTMYYDWTAGASFSPRDFYSSWRTHASQQQLDSREDTVASIRYLLGQLPDPYSFYLTRQELIQELAESTSTGLLGTGAMVEPPQDTTSRRLTSTRLVSLEPSSPLLHTSALPPTKLFVEGNRRQLFSTAVESNLPVVTAVAPHSWAERAGLVVGDRIVAIGPDELSHHANHELAVRLQDYSARPPEQALELTVAKPVRVISRDDMNGEEHDMVVAYRATRLRLNPEDVTQQKGSDELVTYQMLDHSILSPNADKRIGYIRLTRFSKTGTEAFLQAVHSLESAGADAYIIDLRNNYGGVIQQAMLLAASLLRDSHAVLCYTLNARGGFTPHEVREYVVDPAYPGYLLSHESKTITADEVRRELDGQEWMPPSSYASLREHTVKRGLRRPTTATFASFQHRQQTAAQKNIVILLNEGTASSAEAFCAALHDNGRLTALLGSRTFGKGLIQHTFPMPDGGGLRLTVAEYLTPALHHVTTMGGAGLGGLRPDVACESKPIPGQIGTDLCIAEAVDVLEQASSIQRMGGRNDGSDMQRPVTVGLVRVRLHS